MYSASFDIKLYYGCAISIISWGINHERSWIRLFRYNGREIFLKIIDFSGKEIRMCRILDKGIFNEAVKLFCMIHSIFESFPKYR